MRTVLAIVVLGSLTLTLPGCPVGVCGAYQGGQDVVYARGSDQLIVCENGGYAADVAGTTHEGFYTDNPAGTAIAVVGIDGATSQHAFDLSKDGTDSAVIPQFGSGDWMLLSLDKTSLDHADVRCQDLETRAWWNRT
jgi:hypothetical protein